MAGALILLQLLTGHASLLVATALPGDGAAAAAAGAGAGVGAGSVDGEEVVRLVEFCSSITRYEQVQALNLGVCQHDVPVCQSLHMLPCLAGAECIRSILKML